MMGVTFAILVCFYSMHRRFRAAMKFRELTMHQKGIVAMGIINETSCVIQVKLGNVDFFKCADSSK